MNWPDSPIIEKPQMLVLSAVVTGLFARTWVILHASGHAFAADQLFDTLAWNLAIQASPQIMTVRWHTN